MRGGGEKMVGEVTKKPWHKSELLGDTDEDSDTQVDFVAVKASSSCVQSCEVDHTMDSWVQILFAAITGQSLAACPPKPASSVVQTALRVLWNGAQRRCGEMRWNRSQTGPDQQRYLKNGETWLQNINFPKETDTCKVTKTTWISW